MPRSCRTHVRIRGRPRRIGACFGACSQGPDGYLYGRYWLPKVYGAEKGFPWSFLFLIAAAVTEVMQVAMNEWGHSVWITEEIFAVPFHWPFVTYGWLASGIFALWAESLVRLLQIEDEIVAAEAEPSAA